ncbi:hypothetical protein [Kingella oralis]|uniref:hypothetical protein n=1 Tax=Kingella oralis TaxID=505 RepID=UPI0034E4715B
MKPKPKWNGGGSSPNGKHPPYSHIKGSLKKQNRLDSANVFFGRIDWGSGYLTYHKWLMLLPIPLRSAERSILFSETSVRLSDGARSATSSHAPKKGCGLREVCEADLHVGGAFLLL